jgi:opacity protein-like surface antigen
MRKYLAIALFVVISALLGTPVLAQDESPRFNFDIGGGIGWPTSTTSNYVNSGANFVAGAGARLHSDLGFNGEFSWQDLPPKASVIAATGAPGGAARQYSVTGNMLLHTPEGGSRLGGYGIGGIGWYHRSWELTAPTLAIGTTCFPSYAFWGVVCTNGLVSATQVLKSGSSDAFGWNVGGGVTYRLSSHLKAYAEARIHFAYYSGINTRVIPLTFGLRW